MASAPPLRQFMPLLLSMLAMLQLAPQPTHAQLLGLGPCPHYQSETRFTDQRIAELKGSGRYSVLLSHNPDLECMSFNFIDDVKLSFNFKDMRRQDPVLQSERGRYITRPTLFRRRGYMKIDMERNGVLGCNPFGPVKLIPLLFTDSYEVWAACTGLLAVHFEHLFVLVHEPVSLRTDDVTSHRSTSTNSLPSDDVTSLSATSINSLVTNDVSSLPTTSANSSLLPSPSHNYITIRLGSVPAVASSGRLTEAEASIQDNFVNRTHGIVNVDMKRDVASVKSGLGTREARQTLAADIKDDLIARGFPRANALRLKYEACDG